jgi:hypothetical protein
MIVGAALNTVACPPPDETGIAWLGQQGADERRHCHGSGLAQSATGIAFARTWYQPAR